MVAFKIKIIYKNVGSVPKGKKREAR